MSIVMEDNFDNISTASIDAKLYRDLIEHEDKIFKVFIIVSVIFILIFRGSIIYWLKFGIAIPSGYDNIPISTLDEPIQTAYTKKEKKQKSFKYKSLINNNEFEIIPQAHYQLSGLTVAKNHDFVFISDFFDSAALYDLGLSWGKLGDKNFYTTYFKSYSAKTEMTGSRILWTQFKKYPAPVSNDYAVTHFSHSHLVPANRNVMAALLKIKLWKNVQIEGELIDMEFIDRNGRKQTYHTSLSRTDSGYGDRGNGSCETVYVTKVKIGKTVYK